MKIVSTILPLVLAGSVAFAGQSGQTAPPKAPQHKAPLAPGHTTAAPSTAPASDMKTSGGSKSADAASAMTKITREQAGTIAAGTMKGAEVASSELKEVGGKQVWAVTLKEGEKKHEVMVDAADGKILKEQPKHTKHHKEGAAPQKH